MNSSQTRKEQRLAWILFAAATLSSVATLPLYFVGEEGILAVTSLEMGYRGDWLHLWLYGGDAQHGVFANWLIISIASVVGWDRVLAVSRAVMILSTAAAGGMTYLLVRRVWRDVALAVFAAIILVTFADVLFYRGWLAYRDPLFGFLVFSSMAALWIAARERRLRWLAGAVVFVSLAFLTKGLTAYVFFATALFVLLLKSGERDFLLRPAPIVLMLLGAAVPPLWFSIVSHGGGEGMRMTSEILSKLSLQDAGDYAVKLVAYPTEVLLRLLPASALALFYLYRRPELRKRLGSDRELRTAALIGFVGFVPYWLAPQSHFRYLVPLLPWFAIMLAAAISNSSKEAVAITVKWLWVAVALKVVVALTAFPYYQRHYRGENYVLAARDIVARTAGYPLYANDVSSSGLSVTAHIDMLRLPDPPLVFPPEHWDSGFVLSNDPRPDRGKIARSYRLGGDDLYLLCRGPACESASLRRP